MTYDLAALQEALWHLCDDPPERLLLEMASSRTPAVKRRPMIPKHTRLQLGSRPATLLLRLAIAPMKRAHVAAEMGCDNYAANQILDYIRRMKGEPSRGNKDLEPLITYDGKTLRITSAGRYMAAQLLAADIMTDLGYTTVNALETLALIVSETIRVRVWRGDIDAAIEARAELLPEKP